MTKVKITPHTPARDKGHDEDFVPPPYDPTDFSLFDTSNGDEGFDDPAPTLGHYADPPRKPLGNPRLRSPETWEAIREDYMAGEPAYRLAADYGVGVSTIRARAAMEGWRRCDLPEPEPFVLDENAPAPDLEDMARHALARMDHAIKKGRPTEAASWMRTWRALTSPPSSSDLIGGPLPKQPDPVDRVLKVSTELEQIAKQALRDFDTLTPADQSRIDARLNHLLAQLNETQ